jgi:hypothetical protein
VLATLLFLAPLIAVMPQATLAAVVVATMTFPPKTVPSGVRVLADKVVGKELSDEEAQRAADCGEVA